MMKMLAAATGLLSVLAGCVSSSNVPLDSAASKIKVVRDSDKPLRCNVLADVHGMGRAPTDEAARENAQNELRNNAAKYKGANYVLLEADRGGAVGTTKTREAFLNGKAMICKADETADEPAGAGSSTPAPASS